MKFNKKTKKAFTKKVNAWLDHAVTRRDYVYMYAAALGIYAVCAAGILIYYKVDEAKTEKLYQKEKAEIEKMDYTNDEEVDI